MLWFNPRTDVGRGVFRQFSTFPMLEGPSRLIGRRPQAMVATLASTRSPNVVF